MILTPAAAEVPRPLRCRAVALFAAARARARASAIHCEALVLLVRVTPKPRLRRRATRALLSRPRPSSLSHPLGRTEVESAGPNPAREGGSGPQCICTQAMPGGRSRDGPGARLPWPRAAATCTASNTANPATGGSSSGSWSCVHARAAARPSGRIRLHHLLTTSTSPHRFDTVEHQQHLSASTPASTSTSMNS